jgi:hypothetical protein
MKESAPPNQRYFPLSALEVLPHDGDELCRSDIVPGAPVFLSRDAIEVLL